MANISRITNFSGLFDVDTMVQQMMKVESTKLNKIKQDKQIAAWKQTAYRDVISKLSNIKSKYLNLTSSSNIMSKSGLQNGTVSALLEGISTDIVSISGYDSSNKGLTINSITQLATKDTWTGNTSNLRGIKTNLDMDKIKTDGLSFALSINNTAKSIEISSAELSNVETASDLKNILNTKIASAFGSDFNNIVTETADGQLNFDSKGNTVKMLAIPEQENSLSNLGIVSGAGNLDYKNKSIKDLFGITNDDLAGFGINGNDIANLDENDSLNTFINKINNSKSNVNLSYSELNDNFILTSAKEGSTNDITMNESGSNLFAKLRIDDSNREAGKNAKVEIDGVDITTDSNNLSINGMNITLNKLYNGSQGNISVASKLDTNKIIDNVKGFIKDYNEIIDMLRDKLSEKRDYTMSPLTDDQREFMTENEIKLWEDNVKKGLLTNSTELRSLMNNLRNSFSAKVEGSSKSIYDIGISLSKNGNIQLDENKLRNALETDYENTVQFLTNESAYDYGDSSNRTTRYNQNGLFRRIADVLEDNIRITRNSSNKKGVLLELAGMEGDLSNTQNTFSKQISDYDKKIADLTSLLAIKENDYYKKFSSLDSMLMQLNNQSLWISQQFGGGN